MRTANRSRSRLLCCLFAIAVVPLLASCDSWPMFRFGSEHSGFNPRATAIGLDNVATLTERWTAATGAAVRASPVVANGTAYVLSQDTKLYAYNAAGNAGCSGTPRTCTPLWRATVNASSTSTPAVAG